MRDWIRWSCHRPLVVGALVPCLALGAFWGWRVQLARGVQEREGMMRAIAKAGGLFSLDSDFLDPPNYGPPKWVQSLIGDKYFSHIVSVNLGLTSINDETVTSLAKLRHLQSLGIWRTHLDDENLASLARLRELETLDISQTDVTDEGLKQLRQCRSIRTLVIGGDRLTDAGLEPLKEMAHLTLLCVVVNHNQFSPPARQALERALPDAMVVFVPLQQMAGNSPRSQPGMPNPPHRQPPPPPPAPKVPPRGQFT